jgi:hypothetical protein
MNFVVKRLKKEFNTTKSVISNYKKTTLLYYVSISLLLLVTPQMIDASSHLQYEVGWGYILGVPKDWVKIPETGAAFQSPSGDKKIALYDHAECNVRIDTCLYERYNAYIKLGVSADSLRISNINTGGFPSTLLEAPGSYHIFTAANGIMYELIFAGDYSSPISLEYAVMDANQQMKMQNDAWTTLRNAIRCTWPYTCEPCTWPYTNC